MNIFILDLDPRLAASYQCDKHVVKMVLESAQLLCNLLPKEISPYRHTHVNHPCSLWVKKSYANFNWLLNHSFALSEEYTRRFNKQHKSLDVISTAKNFINESNFTSFEFEGFVLAMPDRFKTTDPVISYRNYYVSKRDEWLLKGTRMNYTNSQAPDWMT